MNLQIDSSHFPLYAQVGKRHAFCKYAFDAIKVSLRFCFPQKVFTLGNMLILAFISIKTDKHFQITSLV